MDRPRRIDSMTGVSNLVLTDVNLARANCILGLSSRKREVAGHAHVEPLVLSHQTPKLRRGLLVVDLGLGDRLANPRVRGRTHGLLQGRNQFVGDRRLHMHLVVLGGDRNRIGNLGQFGLLTGL